jgi:hypothetical protein
MNRLAALTLLVQCFLFTTASVLAAPIPVGQANALRVDVEVPAGVALAAAPITIHLEFSDFDAGESFSADVFREIAGILVPPRFLFESIGGILVPFSTPPAFFDAQPGPLSTFDLFIGAFEASGAADGFTLALWMNVGSANLEGFTATAISTTPGGPVELIDSLQNGNAVPEPATLTLLAITLVLFARRPIGRALRLRS